MGVQLNIERQIERIEYLKFKLRELQELNAEILTRRPSSKKWSTIEVIGHMIEAHKVYELKINKALQWKESVVLIKNGFDCSGLISFLIKKFPPQPDGSVRMKMKTTKKFKPVFELNKLNDVDVKEILKEFSQSLVELENWILFYQNNPVSIKKFSSAIGPIVRLNIPEACEFILCHNERHFHQIQQVLKS